MAPFSFFASRGPWIRTKFLSFSGAFFMPVTARQKNVFRYQVYKASNKRYLWLFIPAGYFQTPSTWRRQSGQRPSVRRFESILYPILTISSVPQPGQKVVPPSGVDTLPT